MLIESLAQKTRLAMMTVFAVIGVVVRAVAHGGDIVRQRIDPDIDHMLGVKVHRDAPGKAGAGDA